ncbi:MAG TPA: SCO family protein [Bryobacteraceae bacterium]|jgi:protein SCO1/2|nr:SCO family protein [Bryobacteraceae bacterium]HWA02460.1 SCO family protein [Rhizomicrobium sp.]
MKGPGRFVAVALLLFLAACGEEKPWHMTDITGAMPRLQFRMERANDRAIVTADSYRGRVVILYFGYTHCPDVCPTTLANLSELLRRLDTRAYEVAVLFVSVDPNRDTPDVLEKYVKGFARQVDGLTGPPNGLAALTRRYRVLYRVTKETPGHPYEVMHSNSVFFFDRSGRARLVTTSTDDIDGMTEDVKRLLN